MRGLIPFLFGNKRGNAPSVSPSIRFRSLRLLAACGPLLAAACDGTSASTSDAMCVTPDPASTVICVTPPAAADSSHAYQGVKALVGFYPDDRCTPGTEVMKNVYDLAQTCFGWRREASPSPRDNSATNFQCYRDRVCYTQHTRVLSCDTTPTDKEFRTDACIKDDAGDIWLKLLSGTESCPPAPGGFSCPRSEPGQGNPGRS
jgi:hypothetical protein